MSNNYNEWLLISDVDGTLNDKKMNLPAVNKAAISRFVSKGGNFTLCSGRNLESLLIHYKKLSLEAPVICLNGAGIYDVKKSEALYFKPISLKGENVIFDILKKYKSVQLTVFGMEKIYCYKRKCLYGYIISKLDGLTYKFCKSRSQLPSEGWGKVTLFSMPWVVKKLEKVLKSDYNSNLFDCFFTSPFTLEVVSHGVNKGSAVKKLSDILNIDSENVCAIGDYYNDESMLKSVSHSACCGQAPDDLKEICEYVTCHCNDGAVNDFINYLEKNYISDN